MSVTNYQPTPYNISNSQGLYESYFFPDVIRIIESRMIKWVGHVECMGEERLRKRFWWENMAEEDRSKDVCGRIILKWAINSREGCELDSYFIQFTAPNICAVLNK